MYTVGYWYSLILLFIIYTRRALVQYSGNVAFGALSTTCGASSERRSSKTSQLPFESTYHIQKSNAVHQT